MYAIQRIGSFGEDALYRLTLYNYITLHRRQQAASYATLIIRIMTSRQKQNGKRKHLY